MLITGRTPNMRPRPIDTLNISPTDAGKRNLRNGQSVRLLSRYGAAVLPPRIDATVKPGELFATFHNPPVHLKALTSPHRDRFVKTPEYK